MGVVYLAEQTHPIRRRVALKVIKLGMDTRQVVARFEAERQALALMAHPGIARVFDAGSTPEGRPYFVMEHVAGVSITEYCDRERLDTKARLDLFLKVCEAVQHAHQKGVIHRDLKPSNILVTDVEGQQVAKIIDFGVARATGQSLTERTLHTELGQMIGTPEYMSPEQAEMSGLDVDTRSDVYSLGVVLYELLIGALPFDPGVLRAKGVLELQRVIREEEPPRPSVRLSTLGDRATLAAQSRRSRIDDLVRTLAGELEWIPLKAMRKERAQRYQSVAELAGDVRNYLDGRPLVAGPESRSYRARKFLKRHRVPVALSAAFAILVLGSVVGLALLSRWALREKAAAESARDRAEATASFMSATLSGVGPSVAVGRDTTMLKEMMDRAAARIEEGELSANPEGEIALRRTIAEAYQQIGALDAADRMLRPALDVARSLEGLELAAANVLASLGALEDATGNLKAAEEHLREAVALARRSSTGDNATLAVALGGLAKIRLRAGALADAQPLMQESLDMLRRLHPGDHDRVVQALSLMASVRRPLGDLEGAESLLREALDMRRRLAPGDHPQTATMINNLAETLGDRGQLEAAEAGYRDALAMFQRLLKGDHEALAVGHGNIGAILMRRGRFAEAADEQRTALAIRRRIYPGDHPDLANNLNNLAAALRMDGKLSEAEPLFRESLAMSRRMLPPGHPQLAVTLGNLAGVMRDRGDAAGAEPLVREAVSIVSAAYPATRAERWRLTSEHGWTLVRLRRYAEAERLLLDADKGFASATNPRPNWQQENAARLVELYEQWDRTRP
jgi:tetratricopeptide (TPR) repeat protein